MRLQIDRAFRCICIVAVLCSVLLGLSACREEVLDYDNPDVEVFVHQLKSGEYALLNDEGFGVLPRFSQEDIGELLKYADDLSFIPSFPLTAVSYAPGGKLRLGECILWTVETIRLGHPASMGCKMVRTNADDYEGIYFLTDDEVRDAVRHYRNWWEARKYPRTVWTVDPCYDDPLCGTGYMWW